MEHTCTCVGNQETAMLVPEGKGAIPLSVQHVHPGVALRLSFAPPSGSSLLPFLPRPKLRNCQIVGVARTDRVFDVNFLIKQIKRVWRFDFVINTFIYGGGGYTHSMQKFPGRGLNLRHSGENPIFSTTRLPGNSATWIFEKYTYELLEHPIDIPNAVYRLTIARLHFPQSLVA